MKQPKPVEYFHGLNLGAGVQSTTLELMFRQGLIQYDGLPIRLTAAGFADTQREPAYVYQHLYWLMHPTTPSTHPIVVVSKSDLGADLSRGENSTRQRFATIPAFTAEVEGRKTGIVRRQCTNEYKIRVLERYWRSLLGVTNRQRIPAHKKLYLYFGISLDEKTRATSIWESYHIGRPRKNKDGTVMLSKRTGEPLVRRSPFEPRFPLIEMGMTRDDCKEFLKKQGIPHEVKRSACVFCPFRSDPEWIELQTDDPAGWNYAVELDRVLRMPNRIINRNLNQKLYLHESCIPLDLVQLDPNPKPQKAIQLGLWQNECAGMCGV